MTQIKNIHIFTISLIVGILITLTLGPFFVLSVGGHTIYNLQEKCIEAQVMLLGPSIILADFIFLFLYRKYKKMLFCLIIFIFPILVECGINFHYRHGIIDAKDLPVNDYRHFRGTKVYDLVCDIVDGRPLHIEDSTIIDIHAPYSGITPLMFCIANGYYERAKNLLDMGANPNEINTNTQISPLWMLSEAIVADSTNLKNKRELFDALLEKGANASFVYQEKDVLLLFCSDPKPQFDLIKTLIRYGANVNLKFVPNDEYLHDSYKENESALNMSIYLGNYNVAYYLIEQGADTTGYRDWMKDVMYMNSNRSTPEERMFERELNTYLK